MLAQKVATHINTYSLSLLMLNNYLQVMTLGAIDVLLHLTMFYVNVKDGVTMSLENYSF